MGERLLLLVGDHLLMGLASLDLSRLLRSSSRGRVLEGQMQRVREIRHIHFVLHGKKIPRKDALTTTETLTKAFRTDFKLR